MGRPQTAALLLLCLLGAALASWDADDDPLSTVDVEAVLGRGTTLPCDVQPATREDRVYMVLWFRQGAGRPLYRFDVRGRPLAKALHWSDAAAFGPRAHFEPRGAPQGLAVDALQLDDEGTYRCRVDFRNSPTRNYQVNLVVVVPPHQMLVYANSGRPVSSEVIGPLTEGAELTLTCEVRGGKPPPRVTWHWDEQPAEGQLAPGLRGVVVSRLEVGRVRRRHLHSAFTCRARNTQLLPALEKSARLEMYLRPLSVRLASKPRSLEAGAEAALTCEAAGSRPAAALTWWQDNRRFHRGELTSGDNQTVSWSRLVFAPGPEDDGRLLKCHAENPSVPGSQLDDSLLLSVFYPPQVELQLGSKMVPDSIKEGDDVYFECDIRANPREHRIVWLHDGLVVTQNMSSGVILSQNSLVLQGVTRHASGSYVCVAANTRGETASRPVLLRVQYAPVCRSDEVQLVGASLDETVRVRCEVSADPDDLRFDWQFNHSGESVSVPRARHRPGGAGTLGYTPASERDYGTLACWASNAVGRQAEPCVFQVLPAVRPSPLQNCTLRPAGNGTGAGLQVDCVAGFDGGLPQRFALEAYESRTMKLRLNTSAADQPAFRVSLGDLAPAQTPTLHLVLYAVNARGRSEVAIIEDITLGDAEKRTDATGTPGTGGLGLVPLAALLTGAVLAASLATLLAAVLALRRRRCRHEHGSKPAGLVVAHGPRGCVTSYVVKPAAECERKPDILNPSRDTSEQRIDAQATTPQL
ncbi:B-cell receptor CD22-like isoform X2 [Bacillus rossius redtenbacheri]|uniref:B-cell receptor CD22-like isoform X2 n=1 Tax=Bacillus rossius redtenbacheri TaxID=93214 RepID=UPI002FDDF630